MISATAERCAQRATNDGAAEMSPQPRSCNPACPRCNAGVSRIPRRFIDRLISLIVPVHRYRCRSIICDWEGNLPYKATFPDGWGPVETNSHALLSASSMAPARIRYINKETTL